MSMRVTATGFHNKLVRALRGYGGRVLKAGHIRAIMVDKFPELDRKAKWMQASDHCINRTNSGACDCAEKDSALFKRVSYGEYLVREEVV
jgi:hypothetical protein